MTTKRTCEQAGCTKPPRAKGLCTRHYQRARRGSTGSNERMPDGVMLPPIKLDAKLDTLLRAAVDLSGVTMASWVRDAIGERVLRQSARHPQLRELGAALAEEQ